MNHKERRDLELPYISDEEIMKEQMEKNGLRCTLFSYITQKYEESGAEPGMHSHPHGTEECSCDEIMEWINRQINSNPVL